MKVLLTGANGFVGSHILDSLCSQGIPTAVLLRPSSDRRFLARHLPELEIRPGSLSEPASLPPALADITHLIHCAGRTKAVHKKDFYDTNHQGTLNLLEALPSRAQPVKRFVHISSLAVSGPATAEHPARAEDPPRPVSEYGRSKLAGELEVRSRLGDIATIIRPPAVYGARDEGFLSMFQAVHKHLLPRPSASQALSLVFAKDLAEAVVLCLQHPAAQGKTYFVAAPEIVTARQMADTIARQMKRWTVPIPLPAPVLWLSCLFQELLSRVTRRPALLNLQKFAELRAPGWVCDSSPLWRELGYECPTRLEQGVAETLSWYRQEGWL